MTIILIFVGVIMAVSGIWLLRNGVMTKPWLETGAAPAMGPTQTPPSGRIWLSVVLAIIGCVFALFGSAFVMRMDGAELQWFQLPTIVWVNTALLLGASVLMHRGVAATRRDEPRRARVALTLATIATWGFLVGQLLAWNLLSASGTGLASGPAASFFYLLSGLHGLHILGGLVALFFVVPTQAADPAQYSRRVALCAGYWDFLLVVWLGLITLFLGWANQIADICRDILT